MELYKPRPAKFWPLFRTAIVVAVFGTIIISLSLAGEAVLSQINPPAQGHKESISLVSEITTSHLWLRVLSEVGFAFLIASVVAFFIEYNAKREQTRLLDTAIQDIGHSVIEGVYKIRHDSEYIRTVVNSCLAIRHVRRDYQVMCQLSDFTDNECAELGIVPGTLLKVTAELKYLSENIGNDYTVFEGKYYIPTRRGKLNDFTRVTDLQVGDKVYSDTEIESAKIKMGDPNYISSDKSYLFDIPAHPKHPVPVHIKSVFVKERSDNEIFVYLFPTVGSTIRFFFNVPGLRIGAKARTATNTPEAQTLAEGSYVEWKVSGPLIPNNYVIVWWRSATADGEPEKEIAGPEEGASALELGALGAKEGRAEKAANEGLQKAKFSDRAPFKWIFAKFGWRR